MNWIRTEDAKPPVCEPVLGWWGTHCNPEVIYLNDIPGRFGGDAWFTANDDNRWCSVEPTHWCWIKLPEEEPEKLRLNYGIIQPPRKTPGGS